jgi:hypothetical protein
MGISWTTSKTAQAEAVVASDSSVLMKFADDSQCGGTATLGQQMTATATITLDQDSNIDLLWSAVSEANYEKMTITVNGQKAVTFQAAGDGVCGVGTCTMCSVAEQTVPITLLAGTNVLLVEADSIDGAYHQGAFFAVRFRKEACSEDCSVCDTTPDGRP